MDREADARTRSQQIDLVCLSDDDLIHALRSVEVLRKKLAMLDQRIIEQAEKRSLLAYLFPTNAVSR